VKLTLVAPTRRYHVALVDPLPAGLEAMNPALAVTGSVPDENTEVAAAGSRFAYLRGDRHLVVVNPRHDAATAQLPAEASGPARLLEGKGVQVTGGLVEADGFGYGVFALD
jgi:hypothetical protein